MRRPKRGVFGARHADRRDGGRNTVESMDRWKILGSGCGGEEGKRGDGGRGGTANFGGGVPSLFLLSLHPSFLPVLM